MFDELLSRETLQNFPSYFWNTKIHVVFLIWATLCLSLGQGIHYRKQCSRKKWKKDFLFVWHNFVSNHNETRTLMFSYSKSMAIFEAFHQYISTSISLLFLKSFLLAFSFVRWVEKLPQINFS